MFMSYQHTESNEGKQVDPLIGDISIVNGVLRTRERPKRLCGGNQKGVKHT